MGGSSKHSRVSSEHFSLRNWCGESKNWKPGDNLHFRKKRSRTEWEGHSRSSESVLGYSRNSSRSSETYYNGCSFFAYSWKLPTYSGAFLLTVDNFSFFAYNFSFSTCSFSFFTYSWSFFAYSGKVHLIRALRDCKQRSLTVSKKSPNCKQKNFPLL